MLDRAIGIAGLAFTMIFWALPNFFPQVPSWVSSAGLVVGLLLLGVVAGLFFADRRNKRVRKPVDTALLRLHIYGDDRTPDRLEQENIFRWYYMQNFLTLQDAAGQFQRQLLATTLFVTFEPEVRILTLKVRSPDAKLPSHEVKEFNQRYAIIFFSGNIGVGTLEVTVCP
jgi:hypothetical protein